MTERFLCVCLCACVWSPHWAFINCHMAACVCARRQPCSARGALLWMNVCSSALSEAGGSAGFIFSTRVKYSPSHPHRTPLPPPSPHPCTLPSFSCCHIFHLSNFPQPSSPKCVCSTCVCEPGCCMSRRSSSLPSSSFLMSQRAHRLAFIPLLFFSLPRSILVFLRWDK